MVLFRTYTPKAPETFDGKKDPRILLAIKGTLLDVSAGRGLYGSDGPYGNSAGWDTSCGTAKHSFELVMLTPIDQPLDKLEDLTPAEIENMNGWIEHFTHKYLVAGKLVENTD